jgi:hypothetical protein
MRRVAVVRAASAPAKQSAYIRSVLEEKRLLEGAPCEPGFRAATARTLRAVAVSAEGAVRVGYSTVLNHETAGVDATACLCTLLCTLCTKGVIGTTLLLSSTRAYSRASRLMLLLRVAESNAALRDERKAQAADVEHLRAQLATLRHRVGDPDEVLPTAAASACESRSTRHRGAQPTTRGCGCTAYAVRCAAVARRAAYSHTAAGCGCRSQYVTCRWPWCLSARLGPLAAAYRAAAACRSHRTRLPCFALARNALGLVGSSQEPPASTRWGAE